MDTATQDGKRDGGDQPDSRNASTLEQTKKNPKVNPDADPGATPDGPAGASSQEKRDFLTQDNKSLVAGSGNTLGDGRTAGGTSGIAERDKLD